MDTEGPNSCEVSQTNVWSDLEKQNQKW